MSEEVRLRPVGEDALLLEVPEQHVLSAYDAVRGLLGRGDASAREVVPAARTLLVVGLRGIGEDDLVAAVRRAASSSGGEPQQREVEVPVRYDGDDLEEVARLWDMTTAEVVATHTGASFTVAFCGFAPGFAYCTGLPRGLRVPRRRTPRSRVPAGSVGLAGEFTGVYPTASPGGWQLVGRTELTLWDTDADPPAVLTPGTAVRFVDAGGRR
jgi:KipI family sensor histidine kinase inhibitor